MRGEGRGERHEAIAWLSFFKLTCSTCFVSVSNVCNESTLSLNQLNIHCCEVYKEQYNIQGVFPFIFSHLTAVNFR